MVRGGWPAEMPGGETCGKWSAASPRQATVIGRHQTLKNRGVVEICSFRWLSYTAYSVQHRRQSTCVSRVLCHGVVL